MSFLRGLPVIVALSVLLVLLGAGTASADSGATEYQWLVGSGFICDLAPDACPDIARARNGDTLELVGEGTLSIHPKSVDGGGEFVHKNANGDVLVEGTWEANKLISFHSYGCGGEGLPDDVCGGLAIVAVDASVEGQQVGSGVLQIDCAIGKVPPGHTEGIRVNARGLNFNEKVSGFNVFVKQ